MSSTISQEEVEKYRKLAKAGFAWMLSTTLIWQVISWGLTLITARLLSAEEFGLLAMNEAVLPYLLMLAVFRLDAWIIQQKEVSKSDEEALFTLAIFFGGIATVLALAGSPLVADFYNEPRILAPFQLGAFTLMLKALQVVPDSRLRRAMSFRSLALINLTVGSSRGLLQVYFASTGHSYWSLVYGVLFGELLLTVLLIRTAGCPRRLRLKPAVIQQAARFGFHATVSSVLWILFSTADNLTVGRLFGPEMLGIYSMAFFLAELPISKINGVISPLLLAFFSRVKSSPSEVRSSFLKINAAVMSIISPILFGLAVVADDAVPFVLGEKWTPLIQPLQLMCGVGFLRSAVAGASPIFLALNQPKRLLQWSATNAMVLPIGFYLCAQQFGIYGIFLVWFAVYPITGVWLLIYHIGQFAEVTPREFAKNLVPPVTASIVMVIACTLLRLWMENGTGASPVIRLVAIVTTGAAVYIGSFLIAFPEQVIQYRTMLRSLRR